MSTRALLLDAGNTRLKWAVLDANQIKPRVAESGFSQPIPWLDQGAALYNDLSALSVVWQKWGPLASCYGVNVAGDVVGAIIQKALADGGLKVRWLKTGASACGVENRYHPPESLGVDRWCALLAVRQRTRDASLVVSAGSALTVDAINAEGQFMGGVIVPGLHMMRQALADSTALVGTQYGKVLEFPNTTADAVETGLMAACTGTIEAMRARVKKICSVRPQIFLTGGDASILEPFLPPPRSFIPGLVLEGVYYLSWEDQRT